MGQFLRGFKAVSLFFLLGFFSMGLKAQSVLFNESWNSNNFTAGGWSFSPSQSNWAVGTSYTPTGGSSPNAFFNWSPTQGNYSFALTSQVFDATAITNLTLDYLLLLNNYSTSTLEQFAVEYKTTGSGSWSILENFNNSSGSFSIARTNQSLAGMDGQQFQIRFRVYGQNSFNLNGWGLDDIVIKGTPTTIPGNPSFFIPADLSTGVFVNQPLIWATPFGADGYRLTLGTNAPNYNNLLNNVDIGNVSQYINGNWNPSTTYGWRIIPYNSFGNATGSVFRTFTTVAAGCNAISYCPITYTAVNNNGITNVNFAGINNNSGNETSQYGDYTGLGSFSVFRGTTYPINITHGFSNYVMVYFDWNQDGDFSDADELYNLGASSTSTQSNIPVLVPSTASLGTTRMRVVINTNFTPISCNSGTVYYGQAEDYCILVNAQPSCLPPSNLSATVNSSSSVTLSWTDANAPSAGFQIDFAPQGVAQGSGTIYNSTTLSRTISSLPSATTFRYFVRADCGSGNFSEWVGPYYVTPNNSCAGAAPLGAPTAACTLVNQTGTQLNQDSFIGCAGTYDALYYSFVASSGPAELTITRNNSNIYYLEIIEGNCGTLSYLCCDYFGSGTTYSLYPSGLVAGQTYYLRVVSYSPVGSSPVDISVCYQTDSRTCVMPATADYTEGLENCGQANLNDNCTTAEAISFSGNYVIQGTVFSSCQDEDYRDAYYIDLPQSGVYDVDFFSGAPVTVELYRLTNNDPCGSTTYIASSNVSTLCTGANLTSNTTLNAGGYLLYVYFAGLNGKFPCTGQGINDYQVLFTLNGCAPPLVASINTTETTASVNLIPVTGATQYAWEVVPAGNAQGVGVISSGTSASTSFNITGLTAGTNYSLYLSANCGGTNSAYSLANNFVTLCGSLNAISLPFEQLFDGLANSTIIGPAFIINDAQECWSFANGQAMTGTNNVMYSASGELGITIGNDEYNVCKVSELVSTVNMSSFSGASNILTSFDLAVVENYNLQPEDKVFVRGSVNDPWLTLLDWGTIYNTTFNQGVYEAYADIDLDSVLSANGQNFSATTQFKFSINSCYYPYYQFGYEGITIDNFKIYTCPQPLNAVVTGITSSTATFAWEAPGSFQDFEVYFGADPLPVPDAATVPTFVVAGDTSLVLNGLSAASDYQVYVRTDCGNANSNWTGPISFSTICPAFVPATLPLTENFDGLPNETISNTEVVVCFPSNGFSFETDNIYGRAFTGTDSYQSGIGSPTFTMANDGSGNYADNSLYWSVNLANFSAFSSLLFEMEYMDLGDENDGIDKVYFRGSATDPWIEAYDWASGTDNVLQSITLDIDSILTNNGQAVGAGFQVRVRQYDNFQPGTDGLAINSMRILQDNCGTAPVNLDAEVTGPSSANLSWASTGSETLWDIVVGPYPLTVPGLTTTPTYNDVSSQPFAVSGLSNNGTYEFYVRAQCNAGVTSLWEGPFAFTLNDTCIGAAAITQTTNVSYTSFNERAATLGSVHCANSLGAVYGKDVWFSFVPTTSQVRINIQSSSSYPIGFELLDGNCNANANICCTYNPTNAASLEMVSSALVIGQTYYIKLGIASFITNPVINISVSNPPTATCSTTATSSNYNEAEACGSFVNHTCSSAENISLSANPFYIWGNSINQCSRHDTDAYAFSIPTGGVFQFDLTAPFNSRLQVFNTTAGCASLVQIGNILGNACVLSSANLNLSAGNYVVMVINNGNSNSQINACGVNAQYELKIIGNCSLSSTFITTSPGGTLCAGTPLTLTANPAGASYAWSTGASSQSIVVSSNGTYSVNITDANGCTGSSAVLVNFLSLPTISKGSNSPVCEGGALQLNATGGINYSWTGPNSFSSSLQNPVIPSVTAAAAGTYYLTVTGANGCARLDSLSVSISALPFELGQAPQNLGISGNNQIICANNSATITLLNSQPSVIYQLLDSATNALITSATGTGGSIQLNTGNLNTDRVFKINAIAGSCSNELDSMIHITMSGGILGIGISASGPLTFCQGEEVTLTAQPSGAISYTWSTGNTTQQIVANASGTYSVVVADNGGCTATASVVVTTVAAPVANTSPSGVVGLCAGNSVLVTALPVAGGTTYLWSDGSTASTNSYTNPGSYFVVVSNSTGCIDTAFFNVNLLTTPTVTAGNGGPYCAGNDIELSASGTGISTVLWTGPNGFTSSSLNPQILSSGLAAAGVYTVEASSSDGCTATATTNIVFNGSAPVMSFSGNTDFTSHVVYPLVDNPYSVYRFEVNYSDADGNLPQNGYPKVLMDYEPNGSFSNGNDRVFIMAEVDPLDNDVSDGKIYYYEGTAFPTTANWQTTIRGIDANGCETNFGPAAEPDVLDDADIFIFANDITFSNPAPDTSETIVVSAVIHNESDYPAQNFVVHLVNQYDPGIVYPDINVPLLPAHSTTTVQWTIVTPNVPSWNPMQVFIDYTNQISEPNELDNQAIRPFINGPYNLPGGITVNASPSPATSYAVNGNYVSILGNAVYYGTPVVLANPGVAGATVSVTLVETGAVYNGYTNSNGFYNIGFYTPVTPGLYHVNVSVTDFTLTGDTATQFVLIVPPCSPDLACNLILSPNSVLSNGTVNASVVVANTGCADVTQATLLTFTLSNGFSTPAPIIVPPLAAGQNFSTPLPDLTAGVSGILSMTATADASNLIVESNEANNINTENVSIVIPGIDLYLYSSNINQINYYLCQNHTFSWTIRNGGVLPSGAFNVVIRLYRSGVLQTTFTHSVANLDGLDLVSFSDNYTFLQAGSYSFEVEIDAPTATQGLVSELNETNNFNNLSTNVTICQPDLTVLGCSQFTVAGTDPVFPGNITLQARIYNSGTDIATGPFDVEFNVAGIVYTQTVNTNIATGGIENVSITVPNPSPGNNSVVAFADPANLIVEGNEGNNSYTANLCVDVDPGPFCYGSGWWNSTQVVNVPVNMNVGISNYGIFTPSLVKTKFEVSGPGITGWLDLGYASNVNLITNCVCPSAATLPTPFAFNLPGTYQVRFTADFDNQYIECDETNNEFIVNVEVTNLPDYRILSQFIAPSLLNPDIGEPITIDVSYKNFGVTNIGTQMELFTQVDNTPLDSVQVIGLASGDQLTYTMPSQWSSNVVGVHVIRSIIDHDNQVPESVETSNNEATRAVIVGQSPNLYFSTFTADNLSPGLGDLINLQMAIPNNGDENCDAQVQVSYVNDLADTVLITSISISVPANDTGFFSVPWSVLDNSTNLIAQIVNAVPAEFDNTDNASSFPLGTIQLSVFSVPENCAGSNSGMAIVTASGGIPPYTYAWSNGLDNDTLTGGFGTYTVQVTDAVGNIAGAGVIINLIPDLNPPIIFNVPANITYTATAGECPVTINWSPPSATDDCAVSVFSSNFNPGDGFQSGLTTVTYTAGDAYGNVTTASFVVNIIGTPLTFAGADQTVCSSATLAAFPAAFGTGTWSSASGLVNFNDVHDPAAVASNLAGGNNVLYWTINNGGCTASVDSLVITDTCSCPLISAIPVIVSSCTPGNTGSITLNVSGGTLPYSYLWSNGSTDSSLVNVVAADYDVLITDANGCTAANFDWTIPSVPGISSLSLVTTDASCGVANGAIDLTINGGTAPFNYQWSNGANTEDLSNLGVGNFGVIVADANGCSATNGATINSLGGPSLTLVKTDGSCSLNNGSIDLSIAGGLTPYNVLWTNGETTEDIGNLSAGAYQVTVTDASGCSAVAVENIVVFNSPTLGIITLDPTCGQADGEIDLEVTDGQSPFAYLWNNGATSEDLVALPFGLYQVTVTDASGCSVSTSANLNNSSGPVLALTPTDDYCSAASGSVDLFVSMGTAPYTYLWSNGEITEDIFNLSAGNFSVSVVDALGCGAVANADVVNQVLNLTYNKTDASCGSADGSIDLTVTGAVGSYSYFWSNGETTEDVSSLAAGSYEVIVMDYSGCTDSVTVVINNTGGPTLSATISDETCTPATGSIDVTVSGGTLPYVFLWSGGESTEDLSALAAGTYGLTVTDGLGCISIANFTVNSANPASLSASSINETCSASNGSIDLTVTGGVGPFSFAWDNGATTEDISGLAANTYNVTVTDQNACVATTSVTITNAPTATLSTTQIDETCSASNGSIDLTVSGGVGPFTFAWDNGATTEDISGLAANTYNVTVTDQNACVATANVTINNSSSLSLSTLKVDETCSASNGSIDLTVTGGVGPFSFAWDNGATTEDISGLAANTYNVTVTDQNACVATTSVTITNAPTATLSTTQIDETCSAANGFIDLTVTGGVGPFTFAWDNGATTEDISGLAANTYNVTVTDQNACVATTSVTITNAPTATLSTTQVNETCSASNGSIDLTVSGGVGPFTFAWDNGATTEDISGLAANTYNVTVTDQNACVATTSVTITNAPTATLSTTQVNETCSASNGSIDLTVTGGVGPFTFAWGNGATTEDISGLAANTYNVTVTDQNACVATTSVTITNAPTATLSTTQVDETCSASNGSIDLTVTGGVGPFTFVWDNGATTEDISGLAANTYNVTVTDQNACVATTSVTITNAPTATLSTTQVDETCSAANGSIDLTVTGGVGPFTFVWDNGATTEDISGLAANTYNITVTDQNACVATTSVTITNAPTATLSTTQVDETCSAANGSIDLTVSGGVGPFTFVWDNGATTEDISGLAANTYNVTVTDQNACVATTSVTITNAPTATLSTTQVDETCSAANGSIDLTVTGGVGPFTFAWDNGATTEDISGLAANTYNVTVTDQNACVATTSVTITNVPTATLSTTQVDETCSGSNGSIDLTVSGGVGPFTFAWDNGATTEDISGLAANTYNVTVTDQNACVATASVVIVNSAALVLSTTVVDGVCSIPVGSIDLTVNGGVSPISFSWSNGLSTEDISGLAAGVYSVTVTDGAGCTAITGAIVNDLAGPQSIVLSSYDATCGLNNGAVQVNTVTGGSPAFEYSIDAVNFTFNDSIFNLAPGAYLLYVRDTNTCITTQSFQINALPVGIANAGADTSICSGASITLNGSGGLNYAWDNGAGSTASVQVSPATTTTYTLTITDVNGCVSSDQVMVTVNANPATPVIVASGSTTFCAGDSVQLSSPNAVGNVWSTGSTGNSITVLNSSQIVLVYTDGNGCSASDTTDVLVNPLPLVLISAPVAVCEGSSSIALTNGTPIGGVYSGPGISGNIFNPIQTGAGVFNYQYLYTDINGCTAVDSGQVLVNAKPVLTLLNDSLFYCSGNEAAVLNAVSPAGGTYSGTGVSANTFDPTVAGEGMFTLNYTYTDGNFCTNNIDLFAQVGLLEVELPDNISGIVNEPIAVLSSTNYYRSAGDFEYRWEPASLFSDPNAQYPFITTPRDTAISLTISDGYCTAVEFGRVLVIEPEVVLVVATSNPGNGVYDVLVDNGKDIRTYEFFIFDEAGAIVWQQSGSLSIGKSKIPLNLSVFADGAYILQMRIGSTMKTSKLIKSESTR